MRARDFEVVLIRYQLEYTCFAMGQSGATRTWGAQKQGAEIEAPVSRFAAQNRFGIKKVTGRAHPLNWTEGAPRKWTRTFVISAPSAAIFWTRVMAKKKGSVLWRPWVKGRASDAAGRTNGQAD